MTAADQPTTEPTRQDLIDAVFDFLDQYGPTDLGYDDTKSLAVRLVDATGALYLPAPQSAADTERRSDCGNPEPHDAHNFQNGGPEDGDYCHGLPAPETEVQWGVRDKVDVVPFANGEEMARDYVTFVDSTAVVVKCIATITTTVTRTPWEEA